jgi:putative ABC transport system substrate-binding protein
MKRLQQRWLIATAAGVIACPQAAFGQRRRPRIAVVFNDPLAIMQGPEPAHNGIRPFLQALRERGWREGQEVDVERHSTEGNIERMPALMREVVATAPDVIATVFIFDAMQATATIPIVGVTFAALEGGLTGSLARPSRNFTGVDIQPAMGLNGKRLQLLKDSVPGMRRVAIVSYRSLPGEPEFSPTTQSAAAALGLRLIAADIDVPADIEPAFKIVQRERADALLVVTTSVNYENRHRLIDFALKQKLPAIYQDRGWVVDGGLMMYGSDSGEHWRRLAVFADRLLRGAKVADLPIEYPDRPKLIVNRRAAQAIGLQLPQKFLLQVDEFIE